MKRNHVLLIVGATALLAVAGFAWHHNNQSQRSDALFAAQKSLWQIATPDSLKRQVNWPGNKFILFSKETSVLENSIYLKIKNRTSKNQTVQVSVVTRNTNWFLSTSIFGPSHTVFEKWLVTPSSEQINNMIFFTKKQELGREDISLLPGESILTTSEYVFPYPMEQDFYVYVSSFERVNRGFDKYSKHVEDTVDVRGGDLNAASLN